MVPQACTGTISEGEFTFSQAASPDAAYKDCFLQACDEYNSFGTAASNKKIQIEKALALKLYGLKAGDCICCIYGQLPRVYIVSAPPPPPSLLLLASWQENLCFLFIDQDNTSCQCQAFFSSLTN